MFPVDDFLTPCNSISRKEQLDGPCDIHVILIVIVNTSLLLPTALGFEFHHDILIRWQWAIRSYFSRGDTAIKSRNGQFIFMFKKMYLDVENDVVVIQLLFGCER